MAIVGSGRFLPKPAGRLAVIASSGSGAVRGLKVPKEGRSREGGCGSTTVPAARLRLQHRKRPTSGHAGKREEIGGAVEPRIPP